MAENNSGSGPQNATVGAGTTNGSQTQSWAGPLDTGPIKARVEAATPGPWRECGKDRDGCSCGLVWAEPKDFVVATAEREWEEVPLPPGWQRANASFIAAARTDVPALCVEVERLRAALLDLVSKCEAMKPGLNSAITIAAIHGVPYTGPHMGDELKAARAALGEP